MSTTVTKSIIVRLKATRTKADSILKQNIGDEVTLYAGEWHGMGGWKQPAWTEYSPKTFKSVDDAAEYISPLGDGEHGYKFIPGTMKYVERTTTVTVEEVELGNA